MSELSTEKKSFGPLAPLGWAVFLGCSWTWVIGMFLPVLLVRDYGAWAWVVFAVPNVVGAAAMGWVLRDAAASARFVARHAGACYAFSAVTVAFHVFFAMWMVQRVRGLGPLVLGLAAVMLAIAGVNRLVWGVVVPRFRGAARQAGPDAHRRGFDVIVDDPGQPAVHVIAGPRGGGPHERPGVLTGSRGVRWIGAAAVMGVSYAMWYMLYGQDGLAMPSTRPLGGGGGPGLALASLAPAFLVGFALNPYLDLTFHRARQGTSPAGGRFAFGAGFGVVFFSMIVFTLLYARLLLPAVRGEPLSAVMSIFLCVHLVAQSAFTIAAHLGELPLRRAAAASPARGVAAGAGVLLALALAAAVGWHASTPRLFRGHDLGEVVYWCFLGFYGLVFPGYLWLHGFPGRAGAVAPSARSLAVLAVTVAVAFPMYWMGFVEGRPFWLIPGVVVLLAARAFVPRAADVSELGELPAETGSLAPVRRGEG